MLVTEGMYGTSKSSYLKLENSRMIVRHSQRVDPEKMGARSRFVESIFIENGKGERFLFPTTQLAPGRAMAQHINHGGSFADAVGSQILRMADTYRSLANVSHHVRSHVEMLPEGAQTVRTVCRRQFGKMRKTFERMYRPSGYVEEAARINEQAAALVETGGIAEAEVLPEYIVSRMRKLLTSEGVDLDEALIETAYRACRAEADEPEDGETKDEILDEALPANDGNDPKAETVSVFGKPVNRAAWEALCHGQIALSRPVTIDSRFTNETDEALFAVGEIARVAVDHTLSLLLLEVTHLFETVKENAVLQKCWRVMKKAIAAAGISLHGVSVQSEAVQEYAAWLDGFTAERALVEDDDAAGDDTSEVSDETEPTDDAEAMDEGVLAREDVLLPSGSESDSFADEILAPTVTNPDTDKPEVPDAAYTARIRQLSGIRNTDRA